MKLQKNTRLALYSVLEFALDPTRIALWQSLLKKNDIVHRPLVDVVTVLRVALWPAVVQAGALQLSSP